MANRINFDLLPRPWSSDRPRVKRYQPQISCEVERVSRSRRNAWRFAVFVDGEQMAFGHGDTKTAAERRGASMLQAYTDIHYFKA